MRLKTKLVLALSAMVVALVAATSYVYVSQLIRQRFAEVDDDANRYARQVLDLAQDALQIDLNQTRIDPDNQQELHDAIQDSLRGDPGLNSLLLSIVGYSPIVYDVDIVDVGGAALLHTNSDMQGKEIPARPNFDEVRHGTLRRQIEI